MEQQHRLERGRPDQKRSAVRARILVALFLLIIMGLAVAVITLPERFSLLLLIVAPLLAGLSLTFDDQQNTNGALVTIARGIWVLIKFPVYLSIPTALYTAASWASDSSSATVRFTALALLSGLLTLLVIGISTKNLRERLLRRNRYSGTIGAVLLYCSSVVLLAVGTFGGVTKELSDRRLIQLSPRPVSSEQLADWYLWHLVDAIPLTNLTETLRWSAPFTYEDTWVGALIVLYILTVVLPVINAFRELASDRRPPSSSSGQPAASASDQSPSFSSGQAAASASDQSLRSSLRHKPAASQRPFVVNGPARRLRATRNRGRKPPGPTGESSRDHG
jgi:hypothetical protein